MDIVQSLDEKQSRRHVRKLLCKGYDVCIIENSLPGFNTILKRPAAGGGGGRVITKTSRT